MSFVNEQKNFEIYLKTNTKLKTKRMPVLPTINFLR